MEQHEITAQCRYQRNRRAKMTDEERKAERQKNYERWLEIHKADSKAHYYSRYHSMTAEEKLELSEKNHEYYLKNRERILAREKAKRKAKREQEKEMKTNATD